MSNRKVDTARLQERVVSYSWEDHHSPGLAMLFQACKHMFEFSLQNTSKNVVVIHCNAGKGRTGTAICCYLLYSGLSKNFIHAITYYGHKRFTTGRGCT